MERCVEDRRSTFDDWIIVKFCANSRAEKYVFDGPIRSLRAQTGYSSQRRPPADDSAQGGCTVRLRAAPAGSAIDIHGAGRDHDARAVIMMPLETPLAAGAPRQGPGAITSHLRDLMP